MHYTSSYNSPIGTLQIACDDSALVGLWTENQKYFERTLTTETQRDAQHPLLDQAKAWLDRYFEQDRPSISELPLAPSGSEFRQQVWHILCEIPYGECMTYGEIAQLMAQKTGKEKMASQAVGGAVGHNPISVIIPCHRVVGANGSLTGYAGGIEKKIKLLELEGADLSGMHTPTKGTAL